MSKPLQLDSLIETTAKIETINRRLFATDTVGEKLTPGELLRTMLGALKQFGELRGLCESVETETRQIVASLQPSVESNSYYRGTYCGWGQSCDSIRTIRPSIDVHLPKPGEVELARMTINRTASVLAETGQLWQANYGPTLKAIGRDSVWYMANKKQLPYGAREALSILRVWESAEIDKAYSAQSHKVFGMQFELSDRFVRSIDHVIRKLRIGIDRNALERKDSPQVGQVDVVF